jgi:hypothetical protein
MSLSLEEAEITDLDISGLSFSLAAGCPVPYYPNSALGVPGTDWASLEGLSAESITTFRDEIQASSTIIL